MTSTRDFQASGEDSMTLQREHLTLLNMKFFLIFCFYWTLLPSCMDPDPDLDPPTIINPGQSWSGSLIIFFNPNYNDQGWKWPCCVWRLLNVKKYEKSDFTVLRKVPKKPVKPGQNLSLPSLYRINLQSHILRFLLSPLFRNVDGSNFLAVHLFLSSFLQTIHSLSLYHLRSFLLLPCTNSFRPFFSQNQFPLSSIFCAYSFLLSRIFCF
jgi:hypothetical protein